VLHYSEIRVISVGIKTFLRDEKLFRAIEGVRKNLPDAQLIIADDGEMTKEKDDLYYELTLEGHKVILCPFDSGFGYKSNRIAEALERPYLLIGSDDFDFTPEAAEGVRKMQRILDTWGHLDIVSGRVDNRKYEFYLRDLRDTIQELPLQHEKFILGLSFIECDLTVNYNLIRRRVFEKIGWDEGHSASRIGGGEHGAFYVDIKRAGFRLGFVPGVNIDQQEGEDSERYKLFRRRARSKSRPCFDKRGIKRYILGSGAVDYDVSGN
jgi:GT2 family glycosyltransferase